MDRAIIETDAELLSRMSNDDQAAFEKLYRRYWRRCYVQVLRRSGDAALAEDITQNVFVSLWEKRKMLDVEHVGAYLSAAVRFRFISYLKSEMHRETYEHHLLNDGSPPRNPVEATLRIKELNEAIDRGVAMMPSKTKTIYTLSRSEHYSVKEIARKLNLSEKAVEYHITQSLKTLRLALKDFLTLFFILPEIFWIYF